MFFLKLVAKTDKNNIYEVRILDAMEKLLSDEIISNQRLWGKILSNKLTQVDIARAKADIINIMSAAYQELDAYIKRVEQKEIKLVTKLQTI